jgi:hypothetical protein
MSISSADRWQRLLGGMTEGTLGALAEAATLRARSLGLAVVRQAGDVDIPLTLTPEIIDPAVVQRRARDASAILTSVVKAARAVLSQGVEGRWARELFGHFGPLEAACLKNWEAAEDVTIARVDWFIDGAGQHHALELNATIPAMEAYSDAAARAWIETIGKLAGLDPTTIEGLIRENGSNAEELRRSILAHGGYGAENKPSIAIIHREADSQLRELQALARHFTAAGHPVQLAVAESVALDAQGRAVIDGRIPEILYRHIFARRMPEGSALERIALGQTRSRLQNPVNGQFEVKGLFAELARIVTENNGAGLSLTAEEKDTIQRVVPWTRLLSTDPSHGPEGERVPDLAAFIAGTPERFVLKRSWDYGGKSVLLGRDVVASEGAAGWQSRVQAALADGPGTWVVQALVVSPLRRHLVVHEGRQALWEDVFVDASTYSATGSQSVPGGGVARFARTGVVNIVGGGGVAPLIVTSVAEKLAARLETASLR